MGLMKRQEGGASETSLEGDCEMWNCTRGPIYRNISQPNTFLQPSDDYYKSEGSENNMIFHGKSYSNLSLHKIQVSNISLPLSLYFRVQSEDIGEIPL